MLDLPGLLQLLDIEEIDRDLYLARNPDLGLDRHLYGGQVAAQALRAAAATVDGDRRVNSTHGYFLRLGWSGRPTVLRVHRDRDGRSYSHRRVEAVQKGEVIFSLSASFNIPETGPDFELDPPVDVWDVDRLPLAGLGQGTPSTGTSSRCACWPPCRMPSSRPATCALRRGCGCGRGAPSAPTRSSTPAS